MCIRDRVYIDGTLLKRICLKINTSNSIDGVALMITHSAIIFHNTTFAGSCVSVYSYNSSIGFKGNTTFTNIHNEESGTSGPLTVVQSKIVFEGHCSLMHDTGTNGGAIYTQLRVEWMFTVN